MNRFEFFMAFYSLLLGLGVTQLLSGFANLLRAPVRPALGWLTPLTGGLLLVQIMTSFFDAFSKLRDARLDFVGLAVPTLIGMLYFVCATIVVPAAHDDCRSLDTYFFRQRRWTLGAIIVAMLGTMMIELPLVAGFFRRGEGFKVVYYGFANGLLLVTFVWAMFARSPLLIRILLAANILFLMWLYSPLSPSIFGTAG